MCIRDSTHTHTHTHMALNMHIQHWLSTPFSCAHIYSHCSCSWASIQYSMALTIYNCMPSKVTKSEEAQWEMQGKNLRTFLRKCRWPTCSDVSLCVQYNEPKGVVLLTSWGASLVLSLCAAQCSVLTVTWLRSKSPSSLKIHNRWLCWYTFTCKL